MPQTGQQTYTIDIPGAADFFKLPIPALNNRALKRERIQRMKTARPPLPEALQWIPHVINKLDDAQDLLYTGLFLARPLLRRLPARFIPYIGWALLINDALNLMNGLLGIAVTPGFTKVRALNCVLHAKRCVIDPRQAFAQFLAKGGWRSKLGFVLQGAQALVTITGYGLQLGALMGAISDTIWGAVRIQHGDQVRFRGPPPDDPLGKAARYLMQTTGNNDAEQLLSLEDHALLIAAQNVAVGIILDSGLPINDERVSLLLDTQVPVFEPWEESSIQALIEEGWDPQSAIRPFGAYHYWTPTFSDMIDFAIGREQAWQERFRDEIPNDEFWATLYLMYDDAGMDTISVLTGIPELEMMGYPRDILAVAKLADCGITWDQAPDANTQALMIEWALTLADAQGYKIPTCDHWAMAFAKADVRYHTK